MITDSPKNNSFKILICDDDLSLHLSIKSVLKNEFKLISAYSGAEALVILKNKKIDLVLLDIEINTIDEGLKLIPLIKEVDPETLILMMSGRHDFKTVKEALKKGADDFLQKGFAKEELIITLKQNLEKKITLKKSEQSQFEIHTQIQKNHQLIGKSHTIETLKKTILKVKENQTNIIITGETGSGKEIVARQLRSIDKKTGGLNPFIAVDSSTIQSSMAESILFGHEKGAFTGAFETKKGLFEHADGGILYFDEIGNMPLDIQNKLLRVIQEKEVLRLGSARPISVQFRVVCATNKNLEELCSQGVFKEDLYQRLNVIPIHIPPLRERRDDIPLLIEYFLQKENNEEITFHPSALDVLMNYLWSGNVRELYNMILFICTMNDGSTPIQIENLPHQMQKTSDHKKPTSPHKNTIASYEQNIFYHDVMKNFEKDYLNKIYIQHKGNISQMSASIKVDRSHLFQKLKSYGIHSPKISD